MIPWVGFPDSYPFAACYGQGKRGNNTKQKDKDTGEFDVLVNEYIKRKDPEKERTGRIALTLFLAFSGMSHAREKRNDRSKK